MNCYALAHCKHLYTDITLPGCTERKRCIHCLTPAPEEENDCRSSDSQLVGMWHSRGDSQHPILRWDRPVLRVADSTGHREDREAVQEVSECEPPPRPNGQPHLSECLQVAHPGPANFDPVAYPCTCEDWYPE